MDTWIDLKCPVPATTLWPSGTHWTRGASLNQVKGPKECGASTERRQGWRKVDPRSFLTQLSGRVGVGEARAELTDIALGSETLEFHVNATTAC